jgi:hypothetical protein
MVGRLDQLPAPVGGDLGTLQRVLASQHVAAHPVPFKPPSLGMDMPWRSGLCPSTHRHLVNVCELMKEEQGLLRSCGPVHSLSPAFGSWQELISTFS